MHRRWLTLSLAVPVALVALASFAQRSEASIGVGVQVGPVRLGTVAHRGESYALPPVYVVNTGTQAEAISVRVERLSHGPGLVVPPSWIRVTGPAVQLAPSSSARIPLELVVPGPAQPGGYLSDIVVTGSPVAAARSAHIGVAAATKLVFTVSSAPAPGHSPLISPWMWWVLTGLLVAAAMILGARQFGLRISVERKSPNGSAAGQGNHVADEE
jgi:hypothetical protein